MTKSNVNVTAAAISAALNISEQSAEALMGNRSWMEATVRAVVADQLGMTHVDKECLMLEDSKVQWNMVHTSVNIGPEEDFVKDAYVGALISTWQFYWFVPAKVVLDWYHVGALKDGKMALPKLLRALEALPD